MGSGSEYERLIRKVIGVMESGLIGFYLKKHTTRWRTYIEQVVKALSLSILSGV